MASSHEIIRSQLLQTLDDLYEKDFLLDLSRAELCEKFSLSPQELELVIAPLLANDWAEKYGETMDGTFCLRLTEFGKVNLDESKENPKNEQIRQNILSYLAGVYEKDVHAITGSDSIAQELGITQNEADFNLKILEGSDFIRLYKGGPPYTVSLTPAGKTAHDNPEPKVLFLSHAASDKEIAMYLKETIEEHFPSVNVFASTDPEDLPPGDPWVEKILAHLEVAGMLVISATERGLNRKWVWFESGAAWSRENKILSACLGKIRKGSLPAPFSLYQAINIDDHVELESLMTTISKKFGKPTETLDFSEITKELIRHDVRAEERQSGAKETPYSDEARIQVEKGLGKLNEAEKEAIRLLFLEGELTDGRAIQLLGEKQLVTGGLASVFLQIAHNTGFVQRVWPYHAHERFSGYQGPWQINPHVKPILEGLLFPKRNS